MFLAGFGLGFLLFYVLSPLVFKTQICCGPNGKQIAHILFSVLAGAFGGFLGCRLYRLGVFSIGECLGLVSREGHLVCKICWRQLRMSQVAAPLSFRLKDENTGLTHKLATDAIEVLSARPL